VGAVRFRIIDVILLNKPTALVHKGNKKGAAFGGKKIKKTRPQEVEPGAPERTQRNPMSLFRFSGSFLLRFAERRFCGSLLKAPPRSTR
jgi:hypothetical protein